tara:strand:+ start:453 stop:602 length:150 start_codon:yes stop_codon:yes gene_type:complete
MNYIKFRKNPILFLKALVVFVFLLYLFSDWGNFKAGLLGKQPTVIGVNK